MEIKEVYIEHFGRLTHFRLRFDAGLNVIYAENEGGKTTILAFIKAMFYGFAGTSQDILKNERKKYWPWSGEKMGGSLTFAYRGLDYSLERRFGESKGGDRINLTNLSTGEKIPLQKGEEPGAYLFGIGLGAFENSAFIGQMGSLVDPGRDRKGDITRALSNLVTTGDEGVSYQVVKKHLADSRDALRKARGGGRTDRLRRKEEDLLLKRTEAQAAGRDRDKLLSELDETATQIESLTQEVQNISRRLNEQKTLQRIRETDRVLEAAARDAQARDREAAAREALCFGDLGVTREAVDRWRAKTNLVREREGALTSAREKADAIQELKENAVSQRETILQKAETDRLDAESAVKQKAELLEKAEKYKARNEADRKREQTLYEQNQELETEVREKLAKAQVEQAAAQAELIVQQEAETRPQSPQKNKGWLVLALLAAVGGIALGIWVHPAGWALLAVTVAGLLFYSRRPIAKAEPEPEESPLQAAQTRLSVAGEAVEKLTADLENARARAMAAKSELAELEDETAQAEAAFLEASTQNAMAETRLVSAAQAWESATAALTAARGDLEETITRELARIKMLSARLEEARQELETELAPMTDPETHPLADQASVLDWLTELDTRLDRLQAAQAAAGYAGEQWKALAAGRSLAELKEKRAILAELVRPEAFLLPEEDYLALSREYNQTQTRLQEQELTAQRQKTELVHRWKNAPDPYETEKELRQVGEAIAEQDHFYQVAALAEKYLDEAVTEMQQSFGPEVNQRTVAILRRLTGARYDDAIVSRDLAVTVRETTDPSLRTWEYLSGGTADQVYFALRCAVAGMIAPAGESLPLLLDDAFIQYDDIRCGRAMLFLEDQAKEGVQVILFTCHRRILEAAPQEDARELA